jgi:hypothetical protein
MQKEPANLYLLHVVVSTLLVLVSVLLYDNEVAVPSAIGTTALFTTTTMKISLLVEPSPITYICGYANRFQALLSHLHKRKDQVQLVTTEVVVQNKPDNFLGFPIIYTYGFRLPFYPLMSMSCDWTLKVIRSLWQFQPNMIHCSSPSFMLGSAIFYSRVVRPTPLVVSYHTHLPAYVGGDNSYVPQLISPVVQACMWPCVKEKVLS